MKIFSFLISLFAFYTSMLNAQEAGVAEPPLTTDSIESLGNQQEPIPASPDTIPAEITSEPLPEEAEIGDSVAIDTNTSTHLEQETSEVVTTEETQDDEAEVEESSIKESIPEPKPAEEIEPDEITIETTSEEMAPDEPSDTPRLSPPSKMAFGLQAGFLPQTGDNFPVGIHFESPSYIHRPLSGGLQLFYQYHTNKTVPTGYNKESYHNIYSIAFIQYGLEDYFPKIMEGKLQYFVKAQAGWNFSNRFWSVAGTSSKIRVNSDEDGFVWASTAGAKFLILPSLAVTGEIGYGLHIFQVGIEFILP